jgi:hypothetical protein
MDINRRNFMKKATVAGLTTAAFASAGIPDQEILKKTSKKAAPSDRIRAGFIGVGNRGQGHLRTCLGSSMAEIVAICDISDRSLSDARKLIS